MKKILAAARGEDFFVTRISGNKRIFFGLINERKTRPSSFNKNSVILF